PGHFPDVRQDAHLRLEQLRLLGPRRRADRTGVDHALHPPQVADDAARGGGGYPGGSSSREAGMISFLRHAELVSASISPLAPWVRVARWTLKQVQGDEV